MFFSIPQSKTNKTCGLSCSVAYRKSGASARLANKTKKEKYGDDWNNVNKSNITKLKKYGTLNFTDKANASKLKKYGTLNFTKQANETKLSRYGTVNFYTKALTTIKTLYGSLSAVHIKNSYDRLKQKYAHNVKFLFDSTEYIGVRSDVDVKYKFQCVQCQSIFSDSIRLTPPTCPTCHPPISSHFEQEVSSYMEKMCTVIRRDRRIISPLELDVLVPDKNLAVECNGIYWHSELAGKSAKYHYNKFIHCKRNNIKLLQIWETEWEQKQDIVKSILNRAVGISATSTIYARQCAVAPVTYAMAKQFLTTNHLQGPDTSRVYIGLFYNEHLVSIMSFTTPRFNKTAEWELSRFCSLINVRVVGGAGKLFTHFVRNYNPSSVVTYSDNRFFDGDVYKQLGMTFINYTPPSYAYFIQSNRKNIQLMSRFQFQKHKLQHKLPVYKKDLSEWENMQRNGYNRVWDSGHSKWMWSNINV